MSTYIDVPALARVIAVSLLVGAGLPALFAVGVRALAPVEGRTSRSGLRVAAATLCFAICAATVLYGVYRIVATGGH
ncbi:hypothetical protein [Cellulomonas alba]|uniref:DUF4190 domain-containing protein n=1 Tax=Cellulomonas alba TaxID=3053467 RepID=A0ABT7SIV0_9CELL|nr:hypothetical protein [Cellulomonas alba]MDM7856116.1 hypothetical protein [Cellulomonas alba]